MRSKVRSIFSFFVLPVDLAHIGGSLFPHAHEELPATIGNLQALTALYVDSNRLSGTCLVEPVLRLTHISALPRTMSQLKALKELDVGGNQLQYSDVEFIIESFPQLTALRIENLGLTGRFSPFAKVAPVLRLTHIQSFQSRSGASLRWRNCGSATTRSSRRCR